MTQKQAQKVLVIVVAVSLGVLLLFALLRKIVPGWDPNTSETTSKPNQKPGSRLTALPLTEIDVNTVTPGPHGLLQWPDSSVVPTYHKADLSLYQDRSKKADALKGILIFIDPGLDRTAERTVAANASGTVAGVPFDDNAVLFAIANKTADRLRALGAEVIINAKIESPVGRINQAASIGLTLSERFLDELKIQNFNSSRIESLTTLLRTYPASLQAAAQNPIFSSQGVSTDLRLLLDIERQYNDVLLLSLHLNKAETQPDMKGLRLIYFGSQNAIYNGTAALNPSDPSLQPAYFSYNFTARKRLASLLERNLNGLIPDMNYNGHDGTIQESDVVLQRYSNLTAVEIRPGFVTNEQDKGRLSQNDRQDTIAEAISNSCFEFFCTRLLE